MIREFRSIAVLDHPNTRLNRLVKFIQALPRLRDSEFFRNKLHFPVINPVINPFLINKFRLHRVIDILIAEIRKFQIFDSQCGHIPDSPAEKRVLGLHKQFKSIRRNFFPISQFHQSFNRFSLSRACNTRPRTVLIHKNIRLGTACLLAAFSAGEHRTEINIISLHFLRKTLDKARENESESSDFPGQNLTGPLRKDKGGHGLVD
ncbi:MAG: hypothetical protein BWY49_00128 [Candidatus Omnitrophica bacterium ADurb.Bin314]|nr:MAG: hypothetical protein BWY49_00128 [Candidatus Omnitrophica bacterium ADurb.Bin314]